MEIYIFTYFLMSIIFEADKVWKEPLSIVPSSTRSVHLVNFFFFFVFSKKWRCTPRLLPNKIFPRIFDYLFSFVSCAFLSTNRFPLYAVFNAEQREFRGIGTTLITKLSLTCFTRLYIHVNFFVSISFRHRQKSNISFLISKNKWMEISQEFERKKSKITKLLFH